MGDQRDLGVPTGIEERRHLGERVLARLDGSGAQLHQAFGVIGYDEGGLAPARDRDHQVATMRTDLVSAHIDGVQQPT